MQHINNYQRQLLPASLRLDPCPLQLAQSSKTSGHQWKQYTIHTLSTRQVMLLSVCLSVCLSVGWLAVWLSGCLAACLPVWLAVPLSLCLSVSLSLCLPVCQFICLPACLPACLPVCLSVCLSVSVCLVWPGLAWSGLVWPISIFLQMFSQTALSALDCVHSHW